MGIRRVVARKLTKTFGATAALRGVHATLERGLTVIDGPNGSGKSTLLRIIGTILQPTSGQVVYEPIGEDRQQVRSEIGWLSHEPLAYPDLTGRYNVELAAQLHGLEPRAAWDRVAEQFELGAFAERPLRTNSRGQQQRVALARALVHLPSLVLLDEPTAGLDRPSLSRLMAVVDELLEREAVVAVVSHDPEQFQERTSERLTLQRGVVRRVQQG